MFHKVLVLGHLYFPVFVYLFPLCRFIHTSISNSGQICLLNCSGVVTMCDFVRCMKKEEVGLFLPHNFCNISAPQGPSNTVSLSSVGEEKLCLLAPNADHQRLFQRQLFRFKPRRADGIAAGFRPPPAPLMLRLSGVVNEQRSVWIRQKIKKRA